MNKIDLDTFGKSYEKQTKSDSDFFKIPVGDTKIRILTPFIEVRTASVGAYPNAKYMGILHEERPLKQGEKMDVKGWAWASIRPDNDIKIIQLPMGLIAKISNIKIDPDYSWEGYPAPFDLKISNTGEGGDRYSVVPSPKREPVTEQELSELSKKKSLEDIVQTIIDKQNEKDFLTQKEPLPVIEYPKDEINPDDIPF